MLFILSSYVNIFFFFVIDCFFSSFLFGLPFISLGLCIRPLLSAAKYSPPPILIMRYYKRSWGGNALIIPLGRWIRYADIIWLLYFMVLAIYIPSFAFYILVINANNILHTIIFPAAMQPLTYATRIASKKGHKTLSKL